MIGFRAKSGLSVVQGAFCALALFFWLTGVAGAQEQPVSSEEAPAAPPSAPLEGSLAEKLYGAYGGAIYQIQVIDITSGKKTSIGSGFQFTPDGLIATNYHVVAESIQRPKENRIEFIGDDKSQGALSIVTADVVHDLAIVRRDTPGEIHIDLGTDELPKGAKLYALGNPHDIGFTIIEGTYNGLSDETLYDKKIHFSGSLNPGMSGGPALDRHGHVAGINVSTAGNQISFLVPVRYLHDLVNNVKKSAPDGKGFMATPRKFIEQQLLANQNRYVAELTRGEWETVPFGPVQMPGKINDIFKCWGRPMTQERDPYQHHSSTCSIQDRLFLDNDFTTGPIIYRYDAITAKEDLNLVRFYNLYEGHYSLPLDSYDNATETDVTRFACNTRFVDLAAERWKTSFCVRRYIKYPSLYDMHLYMALVGRGREGLLVSAIAQGVSRENTLTFIKKFMDNIKPLPSAAPPPPAAPQEKNKAEEAVP